MDVDEHREKIGHESNQCMGQIKRDANLPDIPSPPLQSIAFRKEVITRVNAGTPPEQIARDMHVQPETVEVIVEQYRRDGQVNLDSGGHGPIPAETRQKAEALLRDGWTPTNIARRLGISESTARKIKQNMNLADIGTPLHSPQIRKDVVARLQAGTPPAQIAQDMHLQPETVELIDQENRRDRLAVDVLHMQAAQPEAGAGQPPVPTGPRGPGSPPPGTSPGGNTYPPSKRQRVDAPPPTNEETMTPEVLKQLADQIPPEQIAQNLNLEPDVVNRLIEQYLLGETQKIHQAFLTEQAGQPAAAADAPPVLPEVRQEVIRQLNEGHVSADIANNVHLTVFQIDQIRDQYLQEGARGLRSGVSWSNSLERWRNAHRNNNRIGASCREARASDINASVRRPEAFLIGFQCVRSTVCVSGTRVDGITRLDVDNLSQQSVRGPPMAFRIINGDGRGFCADPDDDADSLAEMFVGETTGVANEEFLPLCSRWRRRRRVSWAACSVRDNRRV